MRFNAAHCIQCAVNDARQTPNTEKKFSVNFIPNSIHLKKYLQLHFYLQLMNENRTVLQANGKVFTRSTTKQSICLMNIPATWKFIIHRYITVMDVLLKQW